MTKNYVFGFQAVGYRKNIRTLAAAFEWITKRGPEESVWRLYQDKCIQAILSPCRVPPPPPPLGNCSMLEDCDLDCVFIMK